MEAAHDSYINTTTSLKNYAHVYAAIHKSGVPDIDNPMTSDMVATVLTQHHFSRGLKLYGEEGVAAVLKELQQLHDGMVIKPQHMEKLTEDDKQNALQYLMFLKKKRNGKIKGRGCADGRKQQVYVNKEDASAPTVATESLLLTCLIDAIEQRHIATVDIPGAFIHADMEGPDTFMKLEGKTVHLLTRLDPSKYKKMLKRKTASRLYS